MGYDIGLILPAHNEEENISRIFGKIKANYTPDIENAPPLQILPILIDSGSDDSTLYNICAQADVHQHLGNIHRVDIQQVSEKGLSLARVLMDPDFVVSMRKKEFLTAHPQYSKEQQYEKERWEDISTVMKTEYPRINLDPATCGTHLIKYDLAMKLLDNETFQKYDKPWGLDFLIALLAVDLIDSNQISFAGAPSMGVVELKKGNFDPSRRTLDKIEAQHDTYLEIIAMLKGKKPYMLSKLYGKISTK